MKNDSSVNLLHDDPSFSNDNATPRKNYAQIENDYIDGATFNSIIESGEASPDDRISGGLKPSYSTILLSKLHKNNQGIGKLM